MSITVNLSIAKDKLTVTVEGAQIKVRAGVVDAYVLSTSAEKRVADNGCI